MFRKNAYTYDVSGNMPLSVKLPSHQINLMFTVANNNKSIDQRSHDQNTDINAHFDLHGNQLKTGYSHLSNSWDFLNQLQTTAQLPDNGRRLEENNTFCSPERMARKVSKISDPS